MDLNIFGWKPFNTATEDKRDEYQKLYQDLDELIDEHNDLIEEMEATYSHYKSSIPCMDEGAIPSTGYVQAQERLDNRLSDYMDEAHEYRERLMQARIRAHDQYLHYENKVAAEEKESK
ncbi:hypothetical protein SFC66_06410 [Terribacillus saccharophilus]|uniref:hypothetical protein n=1 Tax=Terribacillus saccharophilus TaxID=361277 RepID=UPI003981F168